MIPFPSKKYQIIYADPPWSYPGGLKNARGIARQHYETMNTEDICNLPVAEVAGGGGLPLPLGNFPKDPGCAPSYGGVGI